VTLQFPDTPSSNLLWSQMVLVWCVAHYFLGRTKPAIKVEGPSLFGRSLVAAFVVAVLPGLSCENCEPRFAVFVMTGLFSAFLLNQRTASQNPKHSPMTPAAREVLFTIAYGLTTGWIIAAHKLEISDPLVSIDLPANQLALATMFTAVGAFMLDGGTIVVRGVLDRCGTKPLNDQKKVDENEFDRGRMIGELERALLLVLVFLDQYFAISFLLGAKGLIRSREFEDRNFAEYFLIGTLTSILLAVAAGIALQRYAGWLEL
jgi:hypothetical protein